MNQPHDSPKETEGGSMMAAEAQVERAADVVYIKDADEKLPLHRTTINGVEVYTVTDPAKVRDLQERFRRLVAPPDPRRSWYRRLRTWLF